MGRRGVGCHGKIILYKILKICLLKKIILYKILKIRLLKKNFFLIFFTNFLCGVISHDRHCSHVFSDHDIEHFIQRIFELINIFPSFIFIL